MKKAAPGPLKLLPKSIATPALLAHVVTTKFVDAVPLNRQVQQLERYDIPVSVATLSNWMLTLGTDRVQPLINLMVEQALDAGLMLMDETTTQVLQSEKSSTSEHYMWVRLAILPATETVPLPGGARASQNDLFVLGRSSSGPVSIVVEGKVKESFGPTLDEWRHEASSGKKERLDFLLHTPSLGAMPAGNTRYQLLHRSASACITGEQYHAAAAILLVHSFSEELVGWTDYQEFTRLFSVEAELGSVQHLTSASTVPLFGLWVVGNCSFLRS
jgi:hypothetical protein